MYIVSFDEFLREAESMFRSSPLVTRMSCKYRNCEGKVVLKVTDNVRVVSFCSDQYSDLNKMAKLNMVMMGLCAHGPLGEKTNK